MSANALPADTAVTVVQGLIEFSLTATDALLVAESLGIRAQVVEHAAAAAGVRAPLLRNRARTLRHLQDEIRTAVKGTQP